MQKKIEWVNLSKAGVTAPAIKLDLGSVDLRAECAGKDGKDKRLVMYKGAVTTPFGIIPVKLTLDVDEHGTPCPRGTVKHATKPADLPAWAKAIKLA